MLALALKTLNKHIKIYVSSDSRKAVAMILSNSASKDTTTDFGSLPLQLSALGLRQQGPLFKSSPGLWGF